MAVGGSSEGVGEECSKVNRVCESPLDKDECKSW